MRWWKEGPPTRPPNPPHSSLLFAGVFAALTQPNNCSVRHEMDCVAERQWGLLDPSTVYLNPAHESICQSYYSTNCKFSRQLFPRMRWRIVTDNEHADFAQPEHPHEVQRFIFLSVYNNDRILNEDKLIPEWISQPFVSRPPRVTNRIEEVSS